MGKVFKFQKDVDTDQIIASQYLLFPTIDEMKVHTFESLNGDFASAVKAGDFKSRWTYSILRKRGLIIWE